ncbi:hypothetical protein ACE193_21580 [Bernardetia sp. OM2101]|uniref:hypothetical protein n=1 Tax=Bernardetia sp. OM2101 TaxID=3344876 RepID=UPI0035CF5C67
MTKESEALKMNKADILKMLEENPYRIQYLFVNTDEIRLAFNLFINRYDMPKNPKGIDYENRLRYGLSEILTIFYPEYLTLPN